MKLNMELELYKFLQSDKVSGYDIREWADGKCYLVWLNFWAIDEFVGLAKRLGTDFSEGGYDVNLQDNCICVDLNELYLDDIDLDKVFEVEEEK